MKKATLALLIAGALVSTTNAVNIKNKIQSKAQG
jgi:hypothetical protein